MNDQADQKLLQELIKICNTYSIDKEITSPEQTITSDMALVGDDVLYFFIDLNEDYGYNIPDNFEIWDYFHTEYELRKSKGFFKFKMEGIRELKKEISIYDLADLITKGTIKE